MTLESCGVGPTVCGSQPGVSGKEAVVLRTPPCTDAEKCRVHHLVEISFLYILTLLYDGVIVTKVTNLRGNDRLRMVSLPCDHNYRIKLAGKRDRCAIPLLSTPLNWILIMRFRVVGIIRPHYQLPRGAKLSKHNGVSMVSNKEYAK
jgi:hypothetical protein